MTAPPQFSGPPAVTAAAPRDADRGCLFLPAADEWLHARTCVEDCTHLT